MGSPLRRFRGWYGASWWQPVGFAACFALTGYVLALVAGNPSLPRMLGWFLGAIVAHDFLAFPIYALADRVVARGSRNYLRIPAAASALLFVVYLPGIVRQGAATYHAATGQTQAPFLLRWVALSAAGFAVSALVYLLRRVLGRRRR